MKTKLWIPMAALMVAIACAMWVWPVTIQFPVRDTKPFQCESLVSAYPRGAGLREGDGIAWDFARQVDVSGGTEVAARGDQINVMQACATERSNRQTNLILFVVISSTVLILTRPRRFLPTRTAHSDTTRTAADEEKPSATDEE